jgi:teichuronic acid biosynthesis glycosyltransferase TuaG
MNCVDVVIPVFNGRETIRAAIESVLKQEGDWLHRIIVIDDGSSDGTDQVVNDLCCPIIEFIRTPNQGVAKARNLGIERSTAEWVAFLDSDDVWMPTKLKVQFAVVNEYCSGFVCGAASECALMPSGVISANMLARGNFVATSSVLVKRSVLQKIIPVFTPGMTFAEDYLAWLKCVTLTPGYYTAIKLLDYTLSEHPRYNWRQILVNIVAVNLRYARFLSQINFGYAQQFILIFRLFIGSGRSVLSIIKRFIRSYRAGVSRK